MCLFRIADSSGHSEISKYIWYFTRFALSLHLIIKWKGTLLSVQKRTFQYAYLFGVEIVCKDTHFKTRTENWRAKTLCMRYLFLILSYFKRH